MAVRRTSASDLYAGRTAAGRACACVPRIQQQAEAFEEAGKEPEAAELALCERLQKPYAHENLAGLFVKTTVSELKKEGMQEEAAEGLELFPEEEVVPYLPQFVREQEENVSGTTRGSAYHRLLEISPLNGRKPGRRKKSVRSSKNTKQTEGCRRNMLLRSMYTRSGHFTDASCSAHGKGCPKQQTAPGAALCAGAFGKPFKYRLSGG